MGCSCSLPGWFARGEAPPLNGWVVCSAFLRMRLRVSFNKRNDARTELTTAQRGSLALWGRNHAMQSMTHPAGWDLWLISTGLTT